MRPLVTATLLASHAAVAPGQDLHLGLRLDLAPGWHVYWENPGDSGLPTSVALAAPGLAIGPPLWPAPSALPAAGGLVNFGYEGVVTLVLPARVDEAALGPQAIRGEARWLACRADQCIPGQAALALDLPVGPAAPGTALDAAIAALPEPVPVQVTDPGWVAVLPVAGAPRVFPDLDLLDALVDVSSTPLPAGTRVALRLRGTPAAGAHALVTLDTPAGPRAWRLAPSPPEAP